MTEQNTSTTSSSKNTVADLTPYGAAKIVNEALVAAGLDEIPTQMMYSYRRQHTGPKWHDNGKTTEAEVREWVKGYVERRKEREAKAVKSA